MCLLRTINVQRPLLSNDILLIEEEEFEKLGDEIYIKVLASDRRGDEISKSYYYFIVNKLKQIGLLVDNAIGFKVVFPFKTKSDNISISDGIMFITDNKYLVYYYTKDYDYNCEFCPVQNECIYDLKTLAKLTNIKIRNEKLNDAWIYLIENVRRDVISSLKFMRVKAEGLSIEHKSLSEAKRIKQSIQITDIRSYLEDKRRLQNE
ncbi:hypothetical protein BFU36_06740 [Sulfolobus sp. A20]|uniref:hypothetical protein n=1 Tax=Sulfolobaceae TaxID=118883 RepID=UPI0008461071|nr:MULTISPECIES: hypothetical protein [unclassified Sulfolobus]AOL16449.1 hypothetical protein BFU36_06740 [Sulfolobus sp. A20]